LKDELPTCGRTGGGGGFTTAQAQVGPSDGTMERLRSLTTGHGLTVHIGIDRLCGLVVGVPGYRSTAPGSIPDATTFFEK
jgi:hypothetical protein